MVVQTGKLLVVATPIGNLGDLSPRATDALANADILACEHARDPKTFIIVRYRHQRDLFALS